MKLDFETLARLLEARLNAIYDQTLRETAPERHLMLLQQVSSDLEEWTEKNRANLPARLAHFLERKSYQKALDFAKAELAEATKDRGPAVSANKAPPPTAH